MNAQLANVTPGARGWWPDQIATGRLFRKPTPTGAYMVCAQAARLREALRSGEGRALGASAAGTLGAGRAVFLLLRLPHVPVSASPGPLRHSMTLVCRGIPGAVRLLPLLPPETPVALCAAARPLAAAGSGAPFATLVERAFRSSREMRTLIDSAVPARTLEAVARGLQVLSSEVRGIGAELSARGRRFAMKAPFLYRDGLDDVLAVPIAFAFKGPGGLAIELGCELVAIDRCTGALEADFARCAAQAAGRCPIGDPRVLN